jgi:hypothetical protein
MRNHKLFSYFLVLAMLLMLSCQAATNLLATPTPTLTSTPTLTPTPLPTPTPTPIPLSEIDLQRVAIQFDELPTSYELSPSELLNGPVEMEEIFSAQDQVHQDVVNAQYTSYGTDGLSILYSNGFFVYSSEAQAKLAFEEIAGIQDREPDGRPNIGDEARLFTTDLDFFSTTMVLWRYQEAVVYLSVAVINETLPAEAEIIDLARTIQGRLEGSLPLE